MATKEPDPIEITPNDAQGQIEPNPKPLEEQSSADLLNKIRDNYRIVKKSIKRSILVLNDETRGLMVRDFTTKVGDKIIGNEKLIDLGSLCEKLEKLDVLLNTSLEYIEWLLLNIEQVEKVEKMIQEYVSENLLRIDPKEIVYFKNTIKNISTKTAVAIPAVGWLVGGVGSGAVVAGTVVGIHTGLISIVAILASIGMGGVAGCGAGIVVTGGLAGLAAGTGIGTAIWLRNAYKIGKERRGKFEEFVEMEKNLDKQKVVEKVTIVSGEFRRLLRQVKDIANKDYNIEDNVREDDRQRDKAVEQYKKVYRDILEDPNMQELSEDKKIKIAKRAAENACKAALENDLVYSNEVHFDKFLRERIETPDGSNSLERGSTGD